PVPGDGLCDRRGADHPVLRRDPAADRGRQRDRGQRRRHAARDPLHHLPDLRLPADPPAAPGHRADSPGAAGRHHPGADVRGRAVADPPLHRPGHRPGGPLPRGRLGPRPAALPVRGGRVAEHYFTPSPAAAHRPGRVHVVLDDLDFECATDAGVFSAGRLDPGTRVLLDTVPPPPGHGDLLDLGTGYGPVALAMAARAPGATVWAVDVNQRALELCAGNAQAAGLPNVRCVAPDAPGLPGQFAAIWSNPPIRIGKPA